MLNSACGTGYLEAAEPGDQRDAMSLAAFNRLPKQGPAVRDAATLGGPGVTFLLRLSGAIDALNRHIGHLVYWLILVAVLVSAGNAVSRYLLDISSNAWLELQWYLFSAVFLLAAGYTLLHNEHVRIDVIIGHLPPRLRAWIDLIGGLFFLLPMALVIMALSWPIFVDSFVHNEFSSDAGGCCAGPSSC